MVLALHKLPEDGQIVGAAALLQCPKICPLILAENDGQRLVEVVLHGSSSAGGPSGHCHREGVDADELLVRIEGQRQLLG